MATGVELGDAWVNVVPSFRGLKQQIGQELGGVVEGKAKGWGDSIKNTLGGAFKAAAIVGGIALAPIGAAIAAYGKEALQASDSAQKFSETLKFAGIDTSKIDELTAATKKYAADTVYDIGDIRNMTAQLAANGVEGYEKLAEAAGNLNAVAGGNKDTFKSVGMVLTQTAGATKLTTENWRQLSDAIPGASTRLKNALADAGAYTGDFSDALQKGEISAGEFNAAILNLGFEEAAITAAASTATFEGAWGNFEATIVDGIASIIDPIKGDLTDAITYASDLVGIAFEKTAAFVQKVGPAIGLIRGILLEGDFKGELASALGLEEDSAIVDRLFALRESIVSVLDSIRGVFGDLQPLIGPILTAVSGKLGLLFQLFKAGSSEAGEALAGAFDQLAATVVPILGQVLGVVQDVLVQLEPVAAMLGEALVTALQAIGPALGQMLPLLGELVVSLVGALQPVLPTIVQLIAQVAQVFATVFASSLTQVVPLLMEVAQVLAQSLMAVLPALGPLLDAVAAVFSALLQAVMPLIPVFQDLVTRILSALLPLLPTIAQLLATVTEVISELLVALAPLLPAIGNVIAMIVQVVAATLPPMIDVLAVIADVIMRVLIVALEAIMPIISAVVGVIASFAEFLTGVLAGDVQRVGDVIFGVWSAISTATQAVWDAIKSVIFGVWSAISGFLTTAIQGILALIQGSWATVQNATSAVWDGIKNSVVAAISGLLSHVMSIKDKVLGAFSGAGQWLWDAGKSIIDGLISGIKSMIDSVKDTLGGLTSMLPDWKGPADVDKRILRPAGRLVISGFQEGLESEYDSVRKSLGGFTNSLSTAPSMTARFGVPATPASSQWPDQMTLQVGEREFTAYMRTEQIKTVRGALA